MTTGSRRQIHREDRRIRRERAGMGLVPDATIAALGDSILDPSSAAQKADSVTFVFRLLHQSDPTGVLFQVGSGDFGVYAAFGGDGFFDVRANAGTGTANAINVFFEDPPTPPIVQIDGYHTYVIALEKDAGVPRTQVSVWIDGQYAVDSSDANDVAVGDWTNAADWFYGDDGPVTLTNAFYSGALTNVGLVSPMEVFFGKLPDNFVAEV